MSVSPTAPLTELQIREAVDRWEGRGLFAIGKLGTRLVDPQVAVLDVFVAELRTETESRSAATLSVPYRGEPFTPPTGARPDIWAVPVSPPTTFENRVDQCDFPNSARIQACATCQRSGQIACRTCLGSGKATCPICHGAGYTNQMSSRKRFTGGGFKNKTVYQPGSGYKNVTVHESGQWVNEPVNSRVKCSCDGGKVTCPRCGGTRREGCPDCTGAGQLLSRDVITINFKATLQQAVLNSTPIPDTLLAAEPGETALSQQATRVVTADAFSAAVDEQAEKLIAAATADAADHKVLHQQYVVRRIPVHQVTYRFRSAKARVLWVYGVADEVFAERSPRSRMKIGMLLAAIAALALLMVWAVMTFLR